MEGSIEETVPSAPLIPGGGVAGTAPPQQQVRGSEPIKIGHGFGDYLKGGGYVIKRFLGGGGGLGTFYEAETREGNRVAVKALSLMPAWEDIQLFEREAQVLKNLSPHGIPEYVDFFEADSFYLVQKFPNGQSLEELVLKPGFGFSEKDIVDIALEVLRVLSYMESWRVVHGRIKPANIIVDSKSAKLEATWEGHVKVAGFGAVQDELMAPKVGASSSAGFETHGYMAPEQSQNRIVSQSDLYALGGTMLYLLSSRQPSDFLQKRLKIHFRDQVQMSGYLADVLEKLLEPAPEDRIQRAQDVISALRSPKLVVEVRTGAAVRPDATVVLAEGSVGVRLSLQQKPAWSKVSISATSSELVLEIPPRGLVSAGMFLVAFDVIWIGIICVFTVLTLVSSSPWTTLFSLPLWGAGLLLAQFTLKIIMARTRLQIVAGGAFSISWCIRGCLGGVTAHGQSQDLLGAKTVVDKGHVTMCQLLEGVKTHNFGGGGLSEVERVWIVEVINSFLFSVQNSHLNHQYLAQLSAAAFSP
ncbi:hypothetical protein CBR_g50609 [Chara braunii]|uniref:non-specific serine/threonine protein kinase n=1 Tax=Chara braunii TaxID=69332 RepID=A0A388M704_CHABU|nr:hypothetical protein CBR_g50609 [Chara braunii]|eukprot:GBG90361.1 hypothetical protein CBR_g50609 [Chara braunii]